MNKVSQCWISLYQHMQWEWFRSAKPDPYILIKEREFGNIIIIIINWKSIDIGEFSYCEKQNTWWFEYQVEWSLGWITDQWGRIYTICSENIYDMKIYNIFPLYIAKLSHRAIFFHIFYFTKFEMYTHKTFLKIYNLKK